MIEEVLHALKKASHGISLVGVAVIVVGFLRAAIRYAMRYRHLGPAPTFEKFKVELGRVLLLGLEILVVADVIETITVAPTPAGLGILACMIGIRTVLGWTTVLEMNGRWPWQKSVPAPQGEAGS